MTARLVVLASGEGTNLQAILDACQRKEIDAIVVGVIADREDTGAVRRGNVAGVPFVRVVLRPGKNEDRRAWDARLGEIVVALEPDFVVLSGFMRILSTEFLQHFPNRVINLHPALPGELPGMHSIERAFAEAQAGSRTNSGVMVHFVPDEGVDVGPEIEISVVPILPEDGLEAFADRMHAEERALLVRTLQSLCHAVNLSELTESNESTNEIKEFSR
jgi:phosphoribosylglycinamide formyltransferase 1